MASVRQKIRPGPDRTRKLILDAAERLMLRDGYSAMTARRIAEEAGCASSLIFHYYQTVEGVTIALYRRSAERELKRLAKALRDDKPLADFWNVSIDVALSAEFMALATHNPAISEELAENARAKRSLLDEAVTRALSRAGIDAGRYPPSGLTFILSALFRSFTTEQAGHMQHGHKEARKILRDLWKSIGLEGAVDFPFKDAEDAFEAI